jgi:hypothetical protein
MNFPAINGFHYSWASIQIASGEDITAMIKEIIYATSRDRGMGRGTSGRKVLRTRGDEDHEASVVFFREEWDAFVGRHGHGFMDKELNWTINYAEEGKPTKTDVLERCVIDSVEAGGSEGTDPSEVSCDLNPMDIAWNGVKGLKPPHISQDF